MSESKFRHGDPPIVDYEGECLGLQYMQEREAHMHNIIAARAAKEAERAKELAAAATMRQQKIADGQIASEETMREAVAMFHRLRAEKKRVGEARAEVAEEYGVTPKTVYNWQKKIQKISSEAF